MVLKDIVMNIMRPMFINYNKKIADFKIVTAVRRCFWNPPRMLIKEILVCYIIKKSINSINLVNFSIQK